MQLVLDMNWCESMHMNFNETNEKKNDNEKIQFVWWWWELSEFDECMACQLLLRMKWVCVYLQYTLIGRNYYVLCVELCAKSVYIGSIVVAG